MFFRTPFFLPLLYPRLTWREKTQEKILYLTFDDGPIPGPTEYVLEQLNLYRAKATFFCIGDNVYKHPDIFRKIVAQGHAIGNHTFNHLKGWNYSLEAYLDNTNKCEDELVKNGIRFPLAEKKLFRPPYGRIKRAQIKSLTDYNIVMWDVLTHDYVQSLSAEKCLAGSINAVRPGSIIVFHDSLKAEKNMRYALPRLLQHFSGLQYSFQTLPRK